MILGWGAVLVLRPAEAGFFSSLGEVFNQSQGYVTELRLENSQTMTLLEAPASSSNPPGRGGGDTTIIEANALLAEGGPLPGAEHESKISGGGHINTYVVRRGDSLSEIAQMFEVSQNTIRWANGISRPGGIKEGQTLVILPISGVKHLVVKGDTLASIAKKYNAEGSEIADFNGLDPGEKLVLGETIIVPDGEFVEPPPSSAIPSAGPLKGTGGPLYAGYYLRPIDGGVKTQGLHGYNGVDLATYIGAPIYAAAEGEVLVSKSSGWNGGYGKYVVVRHPNKTQTLYAHASEVLVSVGQAVTKGQVIAKIGSTGKSTGPHVHFEIRGAANPF